MRNEPELYKQKIRELVAESKKDIPEDFVIPLAEDVTKGTVEKKDEEEAFWIDSDDGESFGDFEEDGSDQEFEDEEGEQEEEEEDEDEVPKKK